MTNTHFDILYERNEKMTEIHQQNLIKPSPFVIQIQKKSPEEYKIRTYEEREENFRNIHSQLPVVILSFFQFKIGRSYEFC